MRRGRHYEMTPFITGAAFILSAIILYLLRGVSARAALAFIGPGLLLMLAGMGLFRRKRG